MLIGVWLFLARIRKKVFYSIKVCYNGIKFKRVKGEMSMKDQCYLYFHKDGSMDIFNKKIPFNHFGCLEAVYSTSDDTPIIEICNFQAVNRNGMRDTFREVTE